MLIIVLFTKRRCFRNSPSPSSCFNILSDVRSHIFTPQPQKVLGYRRYPRYDDVTMGAIASQITSLTIVYSIDCSGAYQSKHQGSASLAFVRGIHRGPVNSPHKWPVTRKMSPFDDVIMRASGQSVSELDKIPLALSRVGSLLGIPF